MFKSELEVKYSDGSQSARVFYGYTREEVLEKAGDCVKRVFEKLQRDPNGVQVIAHKIRI